MNNSKYKTPFNLTLFQDEKGNRIPTNCEYRKKEEAKKYFDKLNQFVNYKINCNLSYYETIYDADLKNSEYLSNKNDIPIRIILIDDRKLELDNKIRLGIITMDLTELKKKYTPDILKYIYEMSKEYIDNIRKSLLQVI